MANDADERSDAHKFGSVEAQSQIVSGLTFAHSYRSSQRAEHHLHPSIPFHRLPAAHAAIRERLRVLQDGYARWHIGLLRSLRASAGQPRLTR